MIDLTDYDYPGAAEHLRAHGSFVFLKDGARYLDPGVPDQWRRLGEQGEVRDPELWRAVTELLLSRLPDLAPRVYFPVPMARQRELDDDVLLERFSYRMIVVDEDQSWTWNGAPVADRTKEFFLSHLGWQPEVERWFFEYQVNPEWIDKSYLEARFTPLVARSLRVEDGALLAWLNTGSETRLELESFELDERERLVCRTESMGVALIDDNERFRLLKGVREDLSEAEFEGLVVPLTWSSAAGPSAGS